MNLDQNIKSTEAEAYYTRYVTGRYPANAPDLSFSQSLNRPYQPSQTPFYHSPYFPETDSVSAPTDLVGAVFQDRLGLVKSKIELILGQISRRKKLSHQVLEEIDRDACYVQSLIFGLAPEQYSISRDRLTLERMKMDLAKQRRMEQVSYFRDTGFMARDLRESLIEYQDESHKGRMMTNMEVKE